MLKKAILSLVLLGIVATGIGVWLYNKPHRDIAAAQLDYEVNASNWSAEFNANDTLTHRKYFEKVVLVSGEVARVQKVDSTQLVEFTADDVYGVSCMLSQESEVPVAAKKATLKCLYAGYLKPDLDFDLPGSIQCISCSLQSDKIQ